MKLSPNPNMIKTCLHCNKEYFDDQVDFDSFCDECFELQDDNYIGGNDSNDDIPDIPYSEE